MENPYLNRPPENLPNANIILILGILSIVFCWWHFLSFVGIALGIIALIMAKKEMLIYHAQPDRYSLSSMNNVKTGRTCAIIGLIVSLIVFLFVILLIIGVIATFPFWGMTH
ncbi:MAG: CCC motif membrane protein [Bacteroidales bacterium]|nr:CCC motif membrane protein [Bacteroidales bacterium]